MNYALTRISNNGKIGPIPASVSGKHTCPPSCPLLENGCFADAFHTLLHWVKVTLGERGKDWEGFLNDVRSIGKNQLWRHNVSGDLKGSEDVIDRVALRQLTRANKGKKGFTYCHYPMDCVNNREAIKEANDGNFIVNLSANNLEQADTYAKLNIAPVVVILPEFAPKVSYTPENRKIVVCPAQNTNKIKCINCELCTNKVRNYIIGFRVHGTFKKKAIQVLGLLN